MNRMEKIGYFIVVFILIIAVFGPMLSGYSYETVNVKEGLASPTIHHIMGQDKLGRDIFTRICYGARVSLLVSLTSVFVSVIIGMLLGGWAGYTGGIADLLFMRLVDILLAFPGILLAIALAAALGPSVLNIIVALSVMGWVGYARLVRGQVLAIKEKEFVKAEEAIGASKTRILIKHILPSTLTPVIVQATFGMAGTILAEASLSFLGLGPQDMPSWGQIINDGIDYLQQAPHIALFPGIFIMLTVMAFNFIGDGLRDRFDPKEF